ncbi:DNA-directed RNA polymerase III subunit RPC7-like [Anarrhichthys ocellatus]|uniref:DNA-directed RNA polymerase III subunit RPC7-like n=1 Tax=Anarrhichthys ocellatus TaxID=433405 RepID=UPI0012ECDAEE|nr:DNA-directed RNA polymerase III subunit RPC7-like [Anarrhichthys ocellatus]XP_031735917.1 DNA-directed RNA polymerase III subunit RPC7-like [Anarrhichthys ocellatus]XP_031735918.1 DNA-directed RNA polymerase III subunit RPC7-like [Anarrhichthys ocellatus]XP_031735919.1 DNA-directed RNA polymerase III subunit RPC7-like [Anarrhichthys ocellatus]XP_031735920.1 DNA-directed RNA polymerase III subunit RPC7-like [Anarrhichthys ocellatus]XP_031735921.1 DNA-directed RNA polymerase III subunit RPC7-
MAGRAGGRGRRMMSFSVEAVGINRGDSLPPSIQQPTPLFPVMEQKPLPLTGGEEAEYLLALKQEFRGAMKTLPFFIQPAAARRDVERYSDKYHSNEQTDRLMDWNPVWKKFPKELRVKKPSRDGVSAAVSCSDRPKSGQKKKKEKEEVLLKLETLQKEEQQSSEEEEEGEEEKKKKQEEEAEGEEEYDEEEFEEETDYIMSYFDNGEEFGGDSDENMDEAIY